MNLSGNTMATNIYRKPELQQSSIHNIICSFLNFWTRCTFGHITLPQWMQLFFCSSDVQWCEFLIFVCVCLQEDEGDPMVIDGKLYGLYAGANDGYPIDRPTLYTNISKYVKWIKKTIKTWNVTKWIKLYCYIMYHL